MLKEQNMFQKTIGNDWKMDFERLCFYHRQKKLADSAAKKLTHLLM
jgi:hypothetical protein